VSKKIFQCPFDTLVIISSNVESDLWNHSMVKDMWLSLFLWQTLWYFNTHSCDMLAKQWLFSNSSIKLTDIPGF
jgi:hypothetical protein